MEKLFLTIFDFGQTFWPNFWPNLSAGMFVTVLGIPIGLRLNRWVLDRGNNEKRRMLIKAMISALDRNIERIKMAEPLRQTPGTLYWPALDLVIFETTSALKYELLEFALAERIDIVREGLAQFNTVTATIQGALIGCKVAADESKFVGMQNSYNESVGSRAIHEMKTLRSLLEAALRKLERGR